MSIFSDISDFLFGGVDVSAQEFQRQANLEAQRAIDVGTQQARADVLGLFPEASQARNLSFQAALDVLGQSIPQQLQAFQQGNIGAQQNILAGLPQFRSAILGGQFDPSVFQPTTIGFDPGFAQQTLPVFPQQAAPRTAVQQQQQAQQALSQLLAGAGNFNVAPVGGPGDGFDGAGIAPTTGGRPLSAQDLDRLQKTSGLLGLLGPLGGVASFGLGEAARQAANQAFQNQAPIGFFEDILRPDILFGSPFDIQQGIAGVSTPGDIARAETNRQAIAQMGGPGDFGGFGTPGASAPGAGTPF